MAILGRAVPRKNRENRKRTLAILRPSLKERRRANVRERENSRRKEEEEEEREGEKREEVATEEKQQLTLGKVSFFFLS